MPPTRWRSWWCAPPTWPRGTTTTPARWPGWAIRRARSITFERPCGSKESWPSTPAPTRTSSRCATNPASSSSSALLRSRRLLFLRGVGARDGVPHRLGGGRLDRLLRLFRARHLQRGGRRLERVGLGEERVHLEVDLQLLGVDARPARRYLDARQLRRHVHRVADECPVIVGREGRPLDDQRQAFADGLEVEPCLGRAGHGLRAREENRPRAPHPVF